MTPPQEPTTEPNEEETTPITEATEEAEVSEGPKYPDIDPTLLSEAGRASAMQDTLDKAAEFSQRGQALEDTLIRSVVKENAVFKSRNRTLVILLSLVLLLAVWREVRSLLITGPQLDNIEEMSDAVKRTDRFVQVLVNNACSPEGIAANPDNEQLCIELQAEEAEENSDR